MKPLPRTASALSYISNPDWAWEACQTFNMLKWYTYRICKSDNRYPTNLKGGGGVSNILLSQSQKFKKRDLGHG